MKFYPQDWRADEKLRLCSLSARGLWIEMLAIMHRSERYGHLLIGGLVPTDAQLAVQVGAPPHEVSELIGQLESAGVFSRSTGGAIYSRRMTRDQRRAQNARKNGKKGGNPSLSKQTEKTEWDNQQVKGGVKPQSPEVRVTDDKSSGVPPSLSEQIWGWGLQYMISTGSGEKNARSQLGKWRNKLGDADTLAALAYCQANSKSDPGSYIEGIIKSKSKPEDERTAFLEKKYGKAA